MSAINFVGITFKETVMLKYQLKLRKQKKASIKKYFLFFAIFFFGLCFNTHAQWLNSGGGLRLPSFEQKYDWQSGNSYSIHRDLNGNTRIRGFNSYTGSNWTTNIDRQGNFSGIDKRSNPWSYNSRSGLYQNFGTGKICWGKGVFRTCN